MDIRDEILVRMKRKGFNCHQLSKMTAIPISTMYDFSRGKSPLGSDALGKVLDALGLVLIDAEELKRLKTPPKLPEPIIRPPATLAEYLAIRKPYVEKPPEG